MVNSCVQGGGGRKSRRNKKRGNQADEPQASKTIATAAQSPASGIQHAHTSSEQPNVVTLYHNAVVLALALASMLNGLLASSVARFRPTFTQLVCLTQCVQLSEPNGLFRLKVASCVLVSRFQIVYSLKNGSSCVFADQTSRISDSLSVSGVTCRQGLQGGAVLALQHQLSLKLELERLLLHRQSNPL
jgi:hypothetical protein